MRRSFHKVFVLAVLAIMLSVVFLMPGLLKAETGKGIVPETEVKGVENEGAKININTVTYEELRQLKDIGEALAHTG